MTHWPHAPPHRLSEKGAYMVTCGTHRKAHFLNAPPRLNLLRDLLFDCAVEYGWELHAWAVLSNHYHFIASSPDEPSTLRRMLSKIHTLSARQFNAEDGKAGRQVWFQFFDTHITFLNSYYARLKYVHQNPSHHGVVSVSENYPWCSAAWFASSARPAFRQTVDAFKTDTVRVMDEFEPLSAGAAGKIESGVPSSSRDFAEAGKPPHSKQ